MTSKRCPTKGALNPNTYDAKRAYGIREGIRLQA